MKTSLSEIKRILPIAKRRTAMAITSFVQKILAGETLVKNLFDDTDGRRKALVCYLPEAFKYKIPPKHHSNMTECRIAAEALHRLGFQVDCASRGKQGIDYSCYDVVFGISCPSFLSSFTSDSSKQPLHIFYSVGAHTFYNFEVTAKRNLDFFGEHGFHLLDSSHYIPGNGMNYYAARLSDAVICLGDDAVCNEFRDRDGEKDKYQSLPAFFFKVTTPDENKDFALCRNNILWFGSAGMIHKGLDIAIEFAARHREFTLHICGGSRQEKAFWEKYMPLIDNNDNIIYHGFVDIESEEFSNVLSECAILLNPSLSESGAVSVLNVLGNGALYPVYSKGTGLNLADVGMQVNEVSPTAFEEALLEVAALPVEELAAKAWCAHRLVERIYTLDNYRENMYDHLKRIITEK